MKAQQGFGGGPSWGLGSPGGLALLPLAVRTLTLSCLSTQSGLNSLPPSSLEATIAPRILPASCCVSASRWSELLCADPRALGLGEVGAVLC